MLVGLLWPSKGSCTIMGYDMLHPAADVRRHVGYCSQHESLSGTLTVWEHVLLFAAIKGIPGGVFGTPARDAGRDMLKVCITYKGPT